MTKRLSHYFLYLVLFITLAHATTYDCATVSPPNSVDAFLTNITGINNAGTLVGTYTVAAQVSGCAHEQTCHGFRVDSSGNFTTVDYPSGTNTQLMAVNNNGVATGQYSSNGGRSWFTVTLSGVFGSVVVPQPYSLVSIYGINDNGALSAVVSTGSGNSFAILQPNGSVTLVPGYNAGSFPTQPGSINNASTMLEVGVPGSQLVDSSGNITPVPIPNAFGLNNLGTVVGFQGPGVPGGMNGPSFDLSMDSSGVVSDVLCPGLPPGVSPITAINDNGVIAGGRYILTPIPGQPQISLSASSLTFPPTPVGQTSPPQTVTVGNTGNARLDIGAIISSSSEFQFLGCVDPTTGAVSLNPGASCTLKVTATPSTTGSRTGTLKFTNSAPGSPGQIAVSVTGTTAPPSCALSSINPGPPAQANFTMQDTNSGLKSIVLLDATNANASIPGFAQGTTSPVAVTATQINAAQASKVDFQVTNMAGAATKCGATFGGPTQWTGLGGSFNSKIAVAGNADGTLEAFVRGTDNAVWTISQNAPDNGWSGWSSLGGTVNGDPVVAVNSDGTLQLFAVGHDNALWTIAQTSPGGPWGSWASLSGVLTSDPAVAVNTDGRLQVFAVGTDQGLWSIAQTSAGGAWSDWNPLYGVIVGDPAVAVNVDGRLDVFVVGNDSVLYHMTQSSAGGSFSGWSSLRGSLASDPVPGINQDGRLQVFARGTDGALWTVAQVLPGGAWSGVVTLSGVITDTPSVALNSDGRLEVFAKGNDGALWRLAQTTPGGSWSAWSSLGGILAGPIAAAVNQDGRVEACVEGSDTALWTIEQTAPAFWN